MDNKNNINKIADEIIKKLIPYFTIHRYDARSTNSVYLKLDYGVCNSIRISDHKGKEHLQYRYNIIIGGENNITFEQYPRYFYNEKTYDACTNLILFDKQQKLKKYGSSTYHSFMKDNEIHHINDKKGFWSQAKLVTKEVTY